MKLLFRLSFLLFFQLSLLASSIAQAPVRVGFYNVENLFDTLDHPTNKDDDFTPDGRNAWDETRLQAKLNQLGKVIQGMGTPGILGLCEVENLDVLTQLTQLPQLKDQQYQIVHFESPDMRGIDAALLASPNSLRVVSSSYIRIPFPDYIEQDYTSRDIIQVKGQLPDSSSLYIFVNHWPSRRGGVDKSEPKRLWVAKHLRIAIDQILADEPEAQIVLMGDFNDEPDNRSVRSVLGAIESDIQAMPGVLYNLYAKHQQQLKGSYNFRGNYNMLDQIIVSGNLLLDDAAWTAKNATIFRPEWIIYQHPRFGAMPNRTYGGPNYYGGFSDHFPVYIDLVPRRE